MSFFDQKSALFITSPRDVTPFLNEELTGLGFPVQTEHAAGIETAGTLEDAMMLNLHLRTAQRVLYRIDEFRARDPEEMYRKVSKIPWERYCERDGYLCVTSRVDNPTIRDSRYAQVKCKDAVVDRFYRRFGRRPDSGPERRGTVIFLYWTQDTCVVYLDTSGESLSRRGYRKIPLAAPMQETLAAAVILASRWNGGGHFINPMCGSGTLAIEAALIALDKPPGLLRNNFGFMHIKGFRKSLWKDLCNRANRKTKDALNGRIIASDINGTAVAAARKNAEMAGVDQYIDFGTCNFSETEVPPGTGVIMLNPEYGERMGDRDALKDTYRGIGDFFKKRCSGYQGYIFTGNLELAKHVGLRTKRRLPFYNGPIECRLLEYDLYEGSNKKK